LGLLHDPGRGVHDHRVDRVRDPGPGPDLSVARSAHQLREALNDVATVVQPQDAPATVAPTWEPETSRWSWASSTWRYMRRNPALIVGLCLLLALVAFVVIGHFVVDPEKARPLSVRPLQPPSPALPLGSDKQGRNLLAVMVVGTPQTLQIGILAGLIGVT